MVYYIEIRYFGKAKKQIKKLINKVDNKFSLRKYRKVTHITLIQPFTTNKQKWLVSDFKKICSKQKLMKFTLDGIGVFPFFVVFVKVKINKELVDFRKKLLNQIKNYCNIIDIKRPYKPHTTIAIKMGFINFFRVWFYLKRKPKIMFTNHILRATLLKEKKILYEYDFLSRKLLNRKQAKIRKVLSKTFKKLKNN